MATRSPRPALLVKRAAEPRIEFAMPEKDSEVLSTSEWEVEAWAWILRVMEWRCEVFCWSVLRRWLFCLGSCVWISFHVGWRERERERERAVRVRTRMNDPYRCLYRKRNEDQGCIGLLSIKKAKARSTAATFLFPPPKRNATQVKLSATIIEERRKKALTPHESMGPP